MSVSPSSLLSSAVMSVAMLLEFWSPEPQCVAITGRGDTSIYTGVILIPLLRSTEFRPSFAYKLKTGEYLTFVDITSLLQPLKCVSFCKFIHVISVIFSVIISLVSKSLAMISHMVGIKGIHQLCRFYVRSRTKSPLCVDWRHCGLVLYQT